MLFKTKIINVDKAIIFVFFKNNLLIGSKELLEYFMQLISSKIYIVMILSINFRILVGLTIDISANLISAKDL